MSEDTPHLIPNPSWFAAVSTRRSEGRNESRGLTYVDSSPSLLLVSRYTKFQSIATITMFFPESFNGDYTQLHFIGFKGEHTANQRDKVVQCVYESQPNLEDHKTETENQVMKSIF